LLCRVLKYLPFIRELIPRSGRAETVPNTPCWRGQYLESRSKTEAGVHSPPCAAGMPRPSAALPSPWRTLLAPTVTGTLNIRRRPQARVIPCAHWQRNSARAPTARSVAALLSTQVSGKRLYPNLYTLRPSTAGARSPRRQPEAHAPRPPTPLFRSGTVWSRHCESHLMRKIPGCPWITITSSTRTAVGFRLSSEPDILPRLF